MTLSWSGKKQVVLSASSDSSLRPRAVMRVMHDDLESIKNGEEPAPLQADTQLIASTQSDKKASDSTVNPFSEEGEAIFQSQAKEVQEQAKNPFNIVSQSVPKPISNFSPQPTLSNGLTSLVPEGKVIFNAAQSSRKRIMTASLIVSSILLIGGGTFYYYFVAKDPAIPYPPPPPPYELSDIGPTVEALPLHPPRFTSDKPNYLSINTEIVSSEDIRNTLTQTAASILEDQMAAPVEFLVTDQSNNPLAFSRFAFLLNLDLAPDVLALIAETFSLYAYNDAGQVRFGLALTVTDEQATIAALANTETALPYALQALILEPGITVPQNIPFSSAQHGSLAVRFANIDSERNVSLDYALTAGRWFIGTSKNTLRAMLDAHSQ